jgi:cysteinyl-tRNA synthetase
MARKFLGDTLDMHLGGEDLIFPHHENEIAQSEALTGKPFARFWVHARFLLVEGEKMSKSLGNFYTLRDLVLKGHKPSSIRYLLASVPYRRQLNFTFDGLKQAASSVERLRNFKLRLETAHFQPGSNPKIAALAQTARERFTAALADDLNTAEALAAVFDMVREANAAADAGEVKRDDVPPLLAVLKQFDEIFDVLNDTDAPKIERILQWAKGEGKTVIAVEAALRMSDQAIEELIARREAARRTRDFKASDAIRAQLADAGVIVEDTKDGVRWKRK